MDPESTTTDDQAKVQQRVIKQAKRLNKKHDKVLDEDGNELSFEDDSDDLSEERNVVHIDDQEVVQEDDSDDWSDDGIMDVDQGKDKKKPKKEKKSAQQIIQEDEE